MAVASDTGTRNAKAGIEQVGLFPVGYTITTGLPGAPTLHVQLTVSTPDKRVTGIGHITQALEHPPQFVSDLGGSYTYLTVMPDVTHILVTLRGFPISPLLQPNCELSMLLDIAWKGGPASFWYVDGGPKQVIENATATLAAPPAIVDLAGR